MSKIKMVYLLHQRDTALRKCSKKMCIRDSSDNGSWSEDQPDQVSLIDENEEHSPRGGCFFSCHNFDIL